MHVIMESDRGIPRSRKWGVSKAERTHETTGIVAEGRQSVIAENAAGDGSRADRAVNGRSQALCRLRHTTRSPKKGDRHEQRVKDGPHPACPAETSQNHPGEQLRARGYHHARRGAMPAVRRREQDQSRKATERT